MSITAKDLNRIRTTAVEKKEKIATAKGTLDEINRSLDEKVKELNDKYKIDVKSGDSIDLSKIDTELDKMSEEVKELYDKSTEIIEKWDE